MRTAITLVALTLLTGAASAQTESPVAKKFDAGPAMQGNDEPTKPMHPKAMSGRHMTRSAGLSTSGGAIAASVLRDRNVDPTIQILIAGRLESGIASTSLKRHSLGRPRSRRRSHRGAISAFSAF